MSSNQCDRDGSRSLLLVDAHAHLDDSSLASFSDVLALSDVDLVVISNSVDSLSSTRNLELAKRSDRIIPFVGIHPGIFRENADDTNLRKPAIEPMIEEVRNLAYAALGIGEIGIDPKYGSVEKQEQLFLSMLSLCEKTTLPITIHSRDSVSKILQILPTFDLKGKVLFHWFAGSESELAAINDRGIFVSYGPAILVSKRLCTLVEKTPLDLILSETDSPTPFSLLNHATSTPFLIASAAFKISLIKEMKLDSLEEFICENTMRYLGTQNSLRVKSK